MTERELHVGNEMQQQSDVNTAQGGRSEPSIAQLLSNLISDAQTLVRREIDLAKAEVSNEIGKARDGAMMLGIGIGAAAIGGLFLLGALAEALVAAGLFDRWVAYLIIGAVGAIAGAILLAVGRQRIAHVDPVPHETIDSLRKDLPWVNEQNQSDRT